MSIKSGLELFKNAGETASTLISDVGLGVRKWNKPTSIEGLRLASGAIGDTVHISPKKMAMNKIGQYYSELYERPIPQDVMDNIMSAIFTENANCATINKRLENLLDPQHEKLFINFSYMRNKNRTLFIDHMKEFETISKKVELLDYRDLVEIIKSEEQLVKLAKAAKRKKSVEKEVVQMWYHSKPHKIEYGQETASAETRELVNLVTGYFSQKNDVEFINFVKSLVEKSHRNDDVHHLYYKIVEGILKQKPKLKSIALEYDSFLESLEGKHYATIEKEIEKFYDNLFKSGRISEYVDMKTIVPDENALYSPLLTLKYIS